MKIIIGVLIITLAIIGLMAWGSSNIDTSLSYFKDTEVACLTNGHQRLADHIHPQLIITVDGEKEIIPANIGIEEGCMSELHTHDDTGIIHAESFMPGRIANFHMGNFFEVWENHYNREGYDLELIQDGESKDSVENIKFKDGSIIEFKYTSTN